MIQLSHDTMGPVSPSSMARASPLFIFVHMHLADPVTLTVVHLNSPRWLHWRNLAMPHGFPWEKENFLWQTLESGMAAWSTLVTLELKIFTYIEVSERWIVCRLAWLKVDVKSRKEHGTYPAVDANRTWVTHEETFLADLSAVSREETHCKCFRHQDKRVSRISLWLKLDYRDGTDLLGCFQTLIGTFGVCFNLEFYGPAWIEVLWFIGGFILMDHWVGLAGSGLRCFYGFSS